MLTVNPVFEYVTELTRLWSSPVADTREMYSNRAVKWLPACCQVDQLLPMSDLLLQGVHKVADNHLAICRRCFALRPFSMAVCFVFRRRLH